MKTTIAILGAGNETGLRIASGLARGPYRLLLADRNGSAGKTLRSVTSNYPDADIEIIDCAREASWEADVIIPTVECPERAEIAEQIRTVVTRKIVITVSPAPELPEQLPHTHIVTVGGLLQRGNECTVTGDDEAAIETVCGIIRDLGLVPTVGKAKYSESNVVRNSDRA